MTSVEPRLPGLTHRLSVLGQTGSGKSVAGAHHLFLHTEAYPRHPWLVFNPKRDELLDSLGFEPVPINKPLPKRIPPGRVFITHPVAEGDDEHVNNRLAEAMGRGRIGLYFDEGYSVPKNSRPFRQALTQGRSKHVPMIVLSQRPVYMDKFVFTEASMFRIFYLLDRDDRAKVRSNTGIVITDDMPNFVSHWYDVATRRRFAFAPGPDDATVRDLFRSRSSHSEPRYI